MGGAFDRFFRRLPRTVILLLGLLAVLVIGVLDYATPRELSLAIFNLLPVLMVAWWVGPASAMGLALLAGSIWFLADRYTTAVANVSPLFDLGTKVGFFVAFAFLLVMVKRLYNEAHEANRLKDEFLATLSHELRTPLHAILGWTHMLRTGTLDHDETRRAIQAIHRNAQAQQQLISEVLDVSRVIAGKFRLDAREVDLRVVVEGAIDTVRPAAEARHVSLRVDLPRAPVVVFGDPGRLQQVVWNLLTNAVKFVPENGSVVVALSRENGEVVLSVTDDGPGIRPDFLPHVFERFRQADSSSTRPHGGLGLGLAIARHIVERHGGRVEAANRADRTGAVFSVRLPHRAAAARRSAEEVPAALPGGVRGPRLKASLAGVEVLLVDDQPDSLESVAAVLSLHGARVRTAAGAEEALEEFRREPPDVLLSDIEMPGTNGYELLRRLRELPAAAGGDVPAVALTAYAGAEQRALSARAGFAAHLVKPLAPSELVAEVARQRSRRHGAATGPARVLVVDDDPDVAETLQLLLASPEREVATARDGPSAIACAAELRPHLVLLDIGMPEMDGFEVARRLRAEPGLDRVRLIALSGYGDEAHRERSRAAGFDRHLVKPVDPKALLELVDALTSPAPVRPG